MRGPPERKGRPWQGAAQRKKRDEAASHSVLAPSAQPDLVPLRSLWWSLIRHGVSLPPELGVILVIGDRA
jgi:hypothetical protein